MKKHNKIIPILIAALLVCLMIAGCGGDAQGENPEQTQGTDAVEQLEVTVANEQELRSLLAQDGDLIIHVTENMEVREGFTVNGTKTLTGDVELKMALGAELGQALLSVSEGSALTLDGPVLDCNYNADGIFVEANATLTSLSGTVKYPGAYGILTYGDVTIEDISIEDSEFIAICAQTGSHVYVKGGSVQRSASNDIYVVNGAYVNISGDTVMEGALEHAMINYGTLEIHDGKFGNVNNYLCDNYGELTVAYQGEEKDGAIEFYGARNSIFLVRKGSTASFSGLYIHDTKRQGIASLGGDTSIANCIFENTGSHSIDIQGGEATVENVVVTRSRNSGLEASNGSQVTVTNFTVESCENIGVASRGANITATNITISNSGRYGITCGDTKTGQGVLTVKDAVITKAGAHGIYVYEEAEAQLENVAASEGAARGIYVAATAKCEISGESSFKNNAKGGVEVRGTLEMNDVVICDNRVQNSGAGVYVADGGSVTMNGGAVYNNTSAVRGGGICVSDATLTISGTNIYGNTAVNHGGGIYVQKNSLVSLKTGQVTGNYSAANGDGIYILSAESQVKVAENFYLGGNDIKVDSTEAVLKFTGNTMNRHSASDPVLVTPNYNAPEGTVVAICNSESIASRIAVASGDGSYEVVQEGRTFVTKFAVADMDMTDADTVYVSSFKELKSAVEGTTSKRNIILTADIEFPERIRLPGGVTINICDDGTQRTLTRVNGFADSFFVTHYGTGLYLTGTAENMLVLDGKGAEDVKNQSLLRVSGSTEIRNVVLRNNGSLDKEHDVRGALVRQLYGDIKIYDSVLSDGNAYSGGALMIDQGQGYVENSVFTNNESTIGGGAIRVADGCELEIVSSQINGNHAGSTGGGIVALGSAKVTATNTAFENNTAVSYGGAVSAQDADTQIKLIGTDGNAMFKNNSSVTAGAVYVVKGVQLEISGYTFDSNKATDGRAGAVTVLDNSTATIINTAFYGNAATGSGGALVVDGSKAELISCEFGKENAGNTAGDKGGAILVTQGGTVEMTCTDGVIGSVKYNTASGEYGGGAVYVDANSTLNAADYVIGNNSAVSGGAIYIAEKANAVCSNVRFIENKTTSKNGGAVYCAGTYEDTASSYLNNNSARHGGAVIVMGTGTATMDGAAKAEMKGNTAAGNGGAVFVNGGGKATVSGYTLEGNTSATGSVQVQVKASAELEGLTFNGETGNEISVNGSLTFHNLTNALLVKSNANASFTVSGASVGSNIQFTPKEYKSQVVLTKADSVTDAEFAAACAAITVTPGTDGKYWVIDNTGKLSSTVATVTAGGATQHFETLADAITCANASGTAKITVLVDTSVTATLEITGDVTIVNASGKEITISRDAEFTGDMFVVKTGSLTLGTNDATETGKLMIDGTSASAIEARTVTVNAEAAFTLGKNAVLQNAKAKVDGAAIYTASKNTFVYGTIQNNVTAKAGAGIDVAADAKVTIDGASFLNNRSAGVAGAIRVNTGAEAECQDSLFQNNQALSGKTYSNGGAVYCAGTFTDTNSSYIGNAGKNGGAVIVMSGGKVTLSGTDAAKAVMQDNTASVNYGGAVFVNGGGEASITGYTLTGNTAGGIQVQAKAAATLKDVAFTGETGNIVQVNGSLTFDNLTGAKLVQANANASFTVSGYQTGNIIEFTPYAYESKVVLTKAEAMAEADFAAACAAITVTRKSADECWSIDSNGMLIASVASIQTGETKTFFYTLESAVDYANTVSDAEIVVLMDTTVSGTLTISKNVTIVNAPGKNVTIRRGADLTGDMFAVEAGSLILGRSADGALVIDGASEDAIAGRTVTVAEGAAFTLGKNATLQGANSTLTGGAIQTAGTTNLYGTVSNNHSTGDGAGVEVTGGTVTIDGAVFSGNSCGASGAGAALCIKSGAAVTCQNAAFTNNTVPANKNGGAIYCAGTFTDTNSSYTGNTAKNGGAIFISGGSVTLTGTDAAKAEFQNNKATGATDSRGGAIFVNGGSASVTGYTFEGNTSTGTKANTGEGAVHIAGGSATLKNVVFQGTAAQKIYVLGSLTFENLTNAQIVQAKSGASITLSADPAGTNVRLKPYSYTVGAAVVKGTGVDLGAIAVTQTDDGNLWFIDGGKLAIAVAGITANGTTKYYTSLNDAVAAAAENAEIEVLANVTLTEAITISRNITIVNASGKSVTISRGAELTADMFTVAAGSLTLGRESGGALIIDGASEAAIAGRTVTVAEGAAFTLRKNATLQGANSTVTGGALLIGGTTYLYGTVSNNASSKDGAGVYVNGGTVTINGAVFNGNTGGSGCGGAALSIKSGVVDCSNATFTNNTVPANKNGGAIYCAGTFTDTNSTYTGNKAKNGGGIFIPASGKVTLTGTDAAKAVFTGNQATGASTSKGGALYVNGGTLVVNGYTFTGNTCTQSISSPTDKKNAQIWTASGSATLTDITLSE